MTILDTTQQFGSSVVHTESTRVDVTKQFRYNVWGLTDWDVPTSASFTGIVRGMDCVELWCGVGAVWKAAAAQGHRSQGFDLKVGLILSQAPLCRIAAWWASVT